MKQDIKFSFGDTKFKYRVSGILIVDNKILTVQINNNGFYCLPGGHVEIMENTEEAILREFYEETGIDIVIDKLLYVTENFLDGKLGHFHELGFYYLLKPKTKVIQKDYLVIEDDKYEKVKLEFKWLEINKLDDFKPEFLKLELLKNTKKELKHFIIYDKK